MIATKPCPNAEVLRKFRVGDLAEKDAESFLSHLAGCTSCMQTLQELKVSDTLFDTLRRAAKSSGLPAVPAEVQKLIERMRKLPAAAKADASTATGFGAAAAEYPTLVPLDEDFEYRKLLAAPEKPDEIGRLGHYRVLKLLGSGGMGVVFLAEDTQLERNVALKMMNPALAVTGSARQRFLREARATAAVKDDHIITIHQVGEERGIPYLAMELLEGEPLDARLRRQTKLPVATTLRIGREIALGLAAAHQRQLLHRDIKPANVWLEHRGSEGEQSSRYRVKILDFGLARAVGGGSTLTQEGAIVGTPAYMAPEQATGDAIDGRCDLFSLGCVLYRLVTGQPAFKGPDTIATLVAVATDNPPKPHELDPSIPLQVSEYIMKLLEKKPEQRPRSAQVVAEELRQLERKPAAAPPTPGRISSSLRRSQSESRRFMLIAAGVLLAVLLPITYFYGGTIIRIINNEGELVIDIAADAKIEVTIKDGEATIHNKENDRSYVLTAGKNYEVQVRELGENGARFGTKRFAITRGGQEKFIASVEFSKVPAPARPTARPKVDVEPPIVPAAPPTGYALRFTETSQEPDFSAVRLPTAGPWTVEGWFTPRRPLPRANEAALLFMVDPCWMSVRGSSQGMKWALGGPVTTPPPTLYSSSKVVPGVTSHVAVTRGPEGVSFFLNGEKQGDPLPIAFFAKESRLRVCLAGNPSRRDVPFQGDVDEVRVSSVVRYRDNFSPKRRFEPDGDTVALFHFDEGLGDVLTDTSSHSRHGKIESPIWVKADGTLDADPDRRAAEYVLSLGGFVRVSGVGQDIRRRDDLPVQPFELLEFNLRANQRVSDNGLSAFAGCRNLRVIDLVQTRVTDDGLAHFRNSKKLIVLDLVGTQIGDAGLAHFKGCSDLKFLWLGNTRVTNAGLANFADCKQLSHIDVVYTPVTDEGLQHFQGITSLRFLSIISTKVGDKGLAVFKNCMDMEEMYLDKSAVTEASIAILKGFIKLKVLGLTGTSIPASKIRELRQVLKGCKINSDGGSGGITAPPVTAKSPPTFTNAVDIEFVLVPKGKAWMGGMAGNPGNSEVEFKQDFYLGKYEVTQEEWQQIMGVNPSTFTLDGKDKDRVKEFTVEQLKKFPVTNVSWDNAQEFLTRLNERTKETGWKYRLPKESEWQYACRGGPLPHKDDYAFDFYLDRPANTLLPDRANFNNVLKRPAKVGSYPANRLGLHDMHGNMAEWVDDLVKDEKNGLGRGMRGGGFTHPAEWCRAVFRVNSPPWAKFPDVGLRIVRVPADAE